MNKIYLGGTEVANAGSGGGGGDMSNYYDKNHIDASFGDIDYALDNISDDIENLDTNIVDVSSYAQDVSARMPIFEYNSATQTLNIIA